MNKYLRKIIISIAVVSVILFLTRKLSSNILGESYEENKNLLYGCLRLLLLLGTILVLKKEKLINWEYTHKNIIITVLVSILLIYSSWQYTLVKASEFRSNVSGFDCFSYSFNCLAIGFFEEFFFRILIFIYLCKIFQNPGNNFKAVLWASFLFAIVHLSRFLTGLTDIGSAISQVVFAFFIGIILQGIFYRFNNIFLVSMLHAYIDYTGMIRESLFRIPYSGEEVSIAEFIQTLLIFALIGLIIAFPIAVLCLRNKDNLLLRNNSS